MTSDVLVLVDIETTGLKVRKDVVIEVAVLPVGRDLIPLDYGFSVVVRHQLALPEMNETVRRMHTDNGLLAELEADGPDVMWPLGANVALCDYVSAFATKNTVPMAGSSIRFDRNFLEVEMPSFEQWFHYRCVDISTMKELYLRWFPTEGEPPKKKKGHRGIDDCYESLAELVWYRDKLVGWHRQGRNDGYWPDEAPGVGAMH